MHPGGVLDRQRALLLEHDGVVPAVPDRLRRLAGVPVGAERRAAGVDQAVLENLAPRPGQPGDQAGEVVPGGEAVADEEDLQRPAAATLLRHVPLMCPSRLVVSAATLAHKVGWRRLGLVKKPSAASIGGHL